MARLALNKSSMTQKQRQLQTYEQFLPSLDLKRRQLMVERNRARTAVAATRAELAEVRPRVRDGLPMLADERVTLDGLVRVASIDVTEENMVGTRLPLLRGVEIAERPYSLLVRPHWVDPLVGILRRALTLEVEHRVAEERLARLERALRTTTQRVNLFDKVLIPRTREEIRSIRLYLGENERVAVVRAKIAKAKKSRAS